MAEFYCVNDGVPAETTDLLRKACERLGVDYREIDAEAFDFSREAPLQPGAMLYTPATSFIADYVAHFLYAPGVATFSARTDGVWFECVAAPQIFASKGLSTPTAYPVSTPNRARLRAYVEALGGFPVILKALGGSNGVGTMRIDSYPTLFSVADYVLEMGGLAVIARYIEGGVHWRVIVVGDRAVAAYRNPPATDDFRTYPAGDRAAFADPIPEGLAAIAVAATQVLELEFSGVDVIEAAGDFYLLEANYPCYFAEAEISGGVDVSGAMLRHLLAKRERLTGRP